MNIVDTPTKILVKTPKKIEVIQVLRGIAVIMVIIFHLKHMMRPGDYLKNEIDFFFNSGAAGVDIFFIISGFIMVFVTRKSSGGIRDFKKFLLKRLLRIWPLYIIATLVFAFITARHDLSAETLLRIIKSIFFIPASYYKPPFFGYSFLSVGWSLNYEIYFYLLIAISLIAGTFRWYIFAMLVIITLILFPLSNGQLTAYPLEAANYGWVLLNLITNPIIWEFVYGVVIGLLYTSSSLAPFLRSIFHIKIITVTVIVLVVWQYLSGFYGSHGPLNWGFGMAFLFLALIFYNDKQYIQFPAWLIYLGDISYSAYLWHIPVAAAISMIFNKLAFPSFATGTQAFLLTLSVTLIVSHLSYQFIEGKFHNYLAKKLKI